jgi:hypothetical protein
LWVRTSTSPLALFYSEEDFRHRCLVFYEANRLDDDDDPLARVLRTLISENRLAHEVTVPEKRTSKLLEKEGPVAFISTTCKPNLGAEVETRILSLHSDGSDEQTAEVVKSILLAAGEAETEIDLSDWHELDRWLAQGPCEVVVPWGRALAEFGLSGPPRLRRDIANLLSLAQAHALLHRATPGDRRPGQDRRHRRRLCGGPRDPRPRAGRGDRQGGPTGHACDRRCSCRVEGRGQDEDLVEGGIEAGRALQLDHPYRCP